ncbi:thioredoxin-like [Varanus komodoensis]|uniref:Thioredoxin n=1 Tax=Varanus komodoensis TaxID=61221 RepID=A0A8D2KZ26_VARKO|nr:thioredoxin-like [Varanus komodoensis]
MQGGGANESGRAAIEEGEQGGSDTSGLPPEGAKMVLVVGSMIEFDTALKESPSKLIVVDFSATWCGPCKMIKPFYHSLVEKYPDVIFIEVDVDDAQDVAANCEVKCMPTFQFYKNGQKVAEFSGANKEKLEENIKSLK